MCIFGVHCSGETEQRKQFTKPKMFVAIIQFGLGYIFSCLVINIPENSQLFYYLICDHLYKLFFALSLSFSLWKFIGVCFFFHEWMNEWTLLLHAEKVCNSSSVPQWQQKKTHERTVQQWLALYCLTSHQCFWVVS